MKIYNELESLGFFEWLSETHDLADTDMKAEYLDKLPLNDIHRTVCNSMAFRWFREKYDLYYLIKVFKDDDGELIFDYVILEDSSDTESYDDEPYTTYEEAELACLIKLIEIVKKKKQSMSKNDKSNIRLLEPTKRNDCN